MTLFSDLKVTGDCGLQALIAKYQITTTTQHLGSNAIDSDENQWLVTFRRGDGRMWTVRYCSGPDEGVRAALHAAESAEVPAETGILSTMFDESRFAIPDFAEFIGELNGSTIPEPGDHIIHKSILLQTAGLTQFLEGLQLPVE